MEWATITTIWGESLSVKQSIKDCVSKLMWSLPLFLAESELATEELKMPLQHNNTVVSGAQKTEQINLTNESEADQRIIILLYHQNLKYPNSGILYKSVITSSENVSKCLC